MANQSVLLLISQATILVKLVLLFLLMASVFSWAVFLKKIKFLRRVRSENQVFLEQYHKMVSWDEMVKKCQDYKDSMHAKVFLRGLAEIEGIAGDYHNIKEVKEYISNHGIGLVRRAVDSAIYKGQEELSEGQTLLASIGSISPFVGLFGTVYGIIHSFQGMGSGQSSIEAIAPGIAEALVATGIGLFAAIPAVLFYNYFNRANDKIDGELNFFANDFLGLVERSYLAPAKNKK